MARAASNVRRRSTPLTTTLPARPGEGAQADGPHEVGGRERRAEPGPAQRRQHAGEHDPRRPPAPSPAGPARPARGPAGTALGARRPVALGRAAGRGGGPASGGAHCGRCSGRRRAAGRAGSTTWSSPTPSAPPGDPPTQATRLRARSAPGRARRHRSTPAAAGVTGRTPGGGTGVIGSTGRRSPRCRGRRCRSRRRARWRRGARRGGTAPPPASRSAGAGPRWPAGRRGRGCR